MVRISSITMPSLVDLGHRAPPGGEKVRRLLSVTLLNDKVCERHFAINAFQYGNDFGIVGKGNGLAKPSRNGKVETMTKFGI